MHCGFCHFDHNPECIDVKHHRRESLKTRIVLYLLITAAAADILSTLL
jgi:hypothetical protein